MMRNAQPHFAPAFRHGMRPGVGMKGAAVRATESRQVAQHNLGERSLEGLPVGVAPIAQRLPQRIEPRGLHAFTARIVPCHSMMTLFRCCIFQPNSSGESSLNFGSGTYRILGSR